MTPETDPSPSAAAAPARHCQNCGAVLLGEHCYACGQPTEGLVRHFSSIIGDFLDSVLGLDSRIVRTIGPLLTRPGYLSSEYFAGRRVRYVSPVRLFVFLSLLAFFAAQLSFNINVNQAQDDAEQTAAEGKAAGISGAMTVAEVERTRDAALAELANARRETSSVPGVALALETAEGALREEAQQRIAQLSEAEAKGLPAPTEDEEDIHVQLFGEDDNWDAESNPVKLDWLPDAGNARLNDMVGRAMDNSRRIRRDPNLLKDAFLKTVPTTLFVLLPLFALMLKLAYVFKKRLYMEHLIVALHSHSFLCAAMLLALVLDALSTWSEPVGWLSGTLGWLEVALLVWMPLYLLLMQKRVYGQGWPMTLLKYGVLGTGYLFLVSLGAAASLMVSLVNL